MLVPNDMVCSKVLRAMDRSPEKLVLSTGIFWGIKGGCLDNYIGAAGRNSRSPGQMGMQGYTSLGKGRRRTE